MLRHEWGVRGIKKHNKLALYDVEILRGALIVVFALHP